MKKRIKKVIAAILATAGAIEIGGLIYAGWNWNWGPFGKLYNVKMGVHPGNNKKYGLEQAEENAIPDLKGKKVIFLGSSVTYGAASKGVSFADYIGKRNQLDVVKEAVSGTTLVDTSEDSYISRLKQIQEENADLFICQLSTNDASQKKPLGTVSDSDELASFDTGTVAGAIEYIICYAKKKWNCPVLFYTNPKYDSSEYERMVHVLLEIQKKWGIGVIDLWDGRSFNNLTKEERELYMADQIHPTQAGYLKWWTPYMEEKIIENLKK